MTNKQKQKHQLMLMWGIVLVTCVVVTLLSLALRNSTQSIMSVIWIPIGILLFGIVATLHIISPPQKRTRFKHTLWGREIE